MTTAEFAAEAVARPATTVSIAGVDWPAYKLAALAVGVVVLIAVFSVTSAVATSVLTAAAATTVIWLAFTTARALTS